MMTRSILSIITATVTTGFLFWAIVFRPSMPTGNDAQKQGPDVDVPTDKSEGVPSFQDLPLPSQKTPNTATLLIPSESSNKKASAEENPVIAKADGLMEEALAHASYEEYKILIGIIEKYEMDILPYLTDSSPAIIDLTERHIFTLAPFYYYVHSDAQPPIRRLLQALRQKYEGFLTDFAAKDPTLAGEAATHYIKLLIDDIAKSGRRRNSDFVFLSFADYKNYRVLFDKLWDTSPGFQRGFALKANILFASFYQMHKDVGPDHNAEVRGYLKNMRVEIITLHQKALRELAVTDKKSAKEKTESIIDLLQNESKLYMGVSSEVSQFISEDLLSYEELSGEF